MKMWTENRHLGNQREFIPSSKKMFHQIWITSMLVEHLRGIAETKRIKAINPAAGVIFPPHHLTAWKHPKRNRQGQYFTKGQFLGKIVVFSSPSGLSRMAKRWLMPLWHHTAAAHSATRKVHVGEFFAAVFPHATPRHSNNKMDHDFTIYYYLRFIFTQIEPPPQKKKNTEKTKKTSVLLKHSKKKKKQEKLWRITLCLISFAIVYPNYIVIFSPLFSNNSVSSPKNFCLVSLLEYLMLVFLCCLSICIFLSIKAILSFNILQK